MDGSCGGQAASIEDVRTLARAVGALVDQCERIAGQIDALGEGLPDLARRLERLEARTAEAVRQRRAMLDTLRAVQRTLNASPGLRATPVEPTVSLVRLATGQRLYVDTRDIGVGSHLLMNGAWEQHHVRLLRDLVRPGHVCLDIGAHLGVFSVFMAALTGREGRVISFEPNPRLFRLLCRSLRSNGFEAAGISEAWNVALGAEDGRAVLRFHETETGSGSLYPPEDAGEWSEIEVPVRAVDGIDIPRDRPLFLKIDAEGSEYPILRGAEGLLGAVDDVTIMMEFTPAFIRRHMAVGDFIGYLGGLGLIAHVQNAPDAGLVRIGPTELEARGECYVFLARRPLDAGAARGVTAGGVAAPGFRSLFRAATS